MSRFEPIYPLDIHAPPAEDKTIDVDGESENEVDDTVVRDRDHGVDVSAEEEGVNKVKVGRKRKSEVWQYFKEFETTVKDKVVRKIKCIHCNKPYTLMASGSTSHLLKHINDCYQIKKSKGQTKDTLVFQDSNQLDYDVARDSKGYDQMKCREIIAKMIIAHELPFMFVEYQWFNILMKYSNPLYQRVSRATIKNDCVKIFETEKDKI
jgi:phage FluMu protein Com